MARATGNRSEKRFGPGGAAERRESPQIAFVEIDSTALQELKIFLLEGSFPVMFVLPRDITADDFAM